jgi:integrase/recombinase XerD
MAKRWGMSALRQSLDDYLALRRSVGYKLEDAARILASFVAFAERAGAGTITTELALSWATQPREASPIWLAHRLSAVPTCTRSTEIPPADLLGAPGY